MQKEEFKVLSDREHVLARSGMYIGSVVPEELSGIIDFKFQTKKISPGLIKIVEEIYQNAIDEHIRTNGEFATKIEVAIENHPIEGTSVTISDNGRGIPIEKHVGEYRPVLAWTTLRAGSNFDDSKRITAYGWSNSSHIPTRENRSLDSSIFSGRNLDGCEQYLIL